MAGEELSESAEEILSPKPNEFYGVSAWRRLGIVFSGPFFNLLLAQCAFWAGIFFMGETLLKPMVGFLPPTSIGFHAGLQSGDIIQKINGIPIESFEQATQMVSESVQQKIQVEVMRQNHLLVFEMIPELKHDRDLLGDPIQYGNIGLSPFIRAVVGTVLKPSPAEKIGLKEGDRITTIDGRPIIFWDELIQIVHENPEKEIEITWQRAEQLFHSKIIPEKKIIKGLTSQIPDKTIGLIGISQATDESLFFHKKTSFFHSFKLSFKKLTQNIALTYRVLSKMLQGQVSKDSLMGPVRLAGMVTKVAKSGFFPWLLFLGFVSLQLAIFNFLPIPALDGGHALFFLIELVIKKPLHLKTQEKINRIGFTLLIGLFIFVVLNDITQLFWK